MTTFRFHPVGSHQPLELDIAVNDLVALQEALTREKFIMGRMTQPDEEGVLAGVLVATGRVQCVVEVS